MPVIAQTAVSIGTETAKAIAGIKDMKARRELDTAIGKLSLDDQRKLNDKLLKAQNQNERLSMLVNAVTTQSIEAEKSKTKKDLQMALVFFGGAVLLLITIAIVKRKK